MDDRTELVGFAYGEDREDGSGRSLGYRLLTPPASGTGEIESLARWLQAAPYPDAWPAVDLFCSVLLGDGRRVIARARYGLIDHTPTQRRGGLELFGATVPAGVSVKEALAVYRWLGQRRESVEDLHQFGGVHRLADIVSLAPPESTLQPETLSGPVPVLPVRLWQDGTFLFAATAPADPNRHLHLLDLSSASSWQWLPLVGPDFPLSTYSGRGPLIAWTAHLAGIAVRLDRTSNPRPEPRSGGQVWRWTASALALAIAGLLGVNWWTMERLRREVAAIEPTSRPEPAAKKPLVSVPEPAGERERFAKALHQLVTDRNEGVARVDRAALLERYEGLVRRYPELAVAGDNEEGKLAVATASLLAARNPKRIDQAIKQALEGKGFSDRLIQAARDHVREQLDGDAKGP